MVENIVAKNRVTTLFDVYCQISLSTGQ
nr:unnamed protein product [Callosobruchus analis]